MKCMVTGGAGFIGSHLVDRLVNEGYTVVVVDDFSAGKIEHLQYHKGNNKVLIEKKSICDDLSQLFRQHAFDVIFHVAARPRVQYSIAHPLLTNDINLKGTLNLLELARESGVKRFIFSSSSSVYGDQERLPLQENMMPKPLSPYALQKLAGEHYCFLYHHIHSMETVALRYFNVYGSRMDPQGGYAMLIPKFAAMMRRGEIPTIYGDGNQTRDFTYVGDVVDANLRAATTTNKNCFGKVMNIGAGRNLSVNQVVAMINKALGTSIAPQHDPPVVEPKDTQADITRAKNLLTWEPKMSFEQGIQQALAEYR